MKQYIDSLVNFEWCLICSGEVIAPVIRLLPWGTIGGYITETARSWSIRDSLLIFLDMNDVAVIGFTQIEFYSNGPFRLLGGRDRVN
jgi:hypothetical protein